MSVSPAANRAAMALIGAFAPPERVAELARAIEGLATSDREAARGVVADLEQVSETLDTIRRKFGLARFMVVCPTCGNKRCPKATDDALDCSAAHAPHHHLECAHIQVRVLVCGGPRRP